MRYFFDNYLTYIMVAHWTKSFESACDGLSVVSEREMQCRHYAIELSKFAVTESND
jgi:hypothetical protein